MILISLPLLLVVVLGYSFLWGWLIPPRYFEKEGAVIGKEGYKTTLLVVEAMIITSFVLFFCLFFYFSTSLLAGIGLHITITTIKAKEID